MYTVNADLPEHVRASLPEAAQTRFRKAVDSAMADGAELKSAHQTAWMIVKASWERPDGGGKWVRKQLQKAAPRTLYVCRYLQNADEFIKWAKGQGFKQTLKPEDLHVTIAHSSRAVDWMAIQQAWGNSPNIDGKPTGELTVAPGGPRLVEPLGDKGAVVLLFNDWSLASRHQEIVDKGGASWDFASYQPHVTITWDAEGLDLSQVEPYNGPLVFGPEVFSEVDNNWADNITEKCLYRMQDAGLIRKIMSTSGYAAMADMAGRGNPYHDPDNGQFTSGPSGGGAAHFAAQVAGKVAAPLAVAAAAGVISRGKDWFVDHAAHSGRGVDNSDAVKTADEKLSVPATQHNVAATVAKEVVRALVLVGVEVAATTAIGKAVKLVMPFLTQPTKAMASAVAAVAFRHVARQIPTSTLLSLATKAVKHTIASRAGGMFKAEVTQDDLVTFQLKRLEEILKDVPDTELAGQHAEEFLKAKDPEMLQRLLNDLEDAGFTDYQQTANDHSVDVRVAKVDPGLGLVFGYAIICKRDGKDYYDLNRDENGERVPEHIPEQSMLEAAIDFAENSRVAKEMHSGDPAGSVVFAFPLTTDIAKALNIQTNTTGLLIAMKPGPDMLAKFKSGELTGFSIGGSRIKSREHEE